MITRGSLLMVCTIIVLLSPSVGGQDVSNQALTHAVALDENNNGTLNDAEIVGAIQLWIQGQSVPGTSTIIDDVLIIELIQIWISGTTLGNEAPTSNSSVDVREFIFENGRLHNTGRAIDNASAGSLVTLTGDLPQDPMVIVGGADMEVVWQEPNAISFFIPYLGDAIEEIDIVVINEESVDIRQLGFSVLPPVEFPNSEQILDDFIAQLKALMESSTTARSIIGESVTALEAQLALWTSEEKRIAAAYIATSSLSQWIAQFDTQATLTPNRISKVSPQQTTPSRRLDLAVIFKVAQRIIKGNRIGPKVGFGLNYPFKAFSLTRVFEEVDFLSDPRCIVQPRFNLPNLSAFSLVQLKMEAIGETSSVDFEPALPFTKSLTNKTNDNKEVRQILTISPLIQGRTRSILIKCIATDIGGSTGVAFGVILVEDGVAPVVSLNVPQKEVIVGQGFEFEWNADDTAVSNLATPQGIVQAFVNQKGKETLPLNAIILENILLIEPASWLYEAIGKLPTPPHSYNTLYPVKVSEKGKGTCISVGQVTFRITARDWALKESNSNAVTVKCVKSGGIPQITDFGGPSMLSNGETGNVVLSFSDSLGDINEVTSKVKNGAGVGSTQNFPLNTNGAQTGNLTFPITCRNTGTTAVTEQIEFTLKDALGQSSNTITFSYVCKPTIPVTPPPSTPPVIQEITSPAMIIGDNQSHEVIVEFSDAEGDVDRIRGRTLQGPGAGPPQEFPLSLVDQFAGTFSLSISCLNTEETPFNVVTELILVDLANNESSPKTFTYVCYPNHG